MRVNPIKHEMKNYRWTKKGHNNRKIKQKNWHNIMDDDNEGKTVLP